MKSRYSFLDLDTTKTIGHINDCTLRDLGLTSVFDASIVSQLAVIPDGETASARREIMEAIIGERENYAFLEELRISLADFSRACKVYDESASDLERAFSGTVCAERFCGALSLIEGLMDTKLTVAIKEKIKKQKENVNILRDETKSITSKLSAVSNLTLTHGRVAVSDTSGDLSDILSSVISSLGFELPRSKGSAVRVYPELSGEVKRVFPDLFEEADRFLKGSFAFVDRGIIDLRDDLDFYLRTAAAFLSAKEKGLPVCFAEVADSPMYHAEGMIDPTLIKHVDRIVPNSVRLDRETHVAYLMGANGGGKTSYLRGVASNLIFFLCGLPVFCCSAQIFPFRSVVAFFPKEERSFNSGRFDEEKSRIDDYISQADQYGFAFFNEVFSGTGEVRAESELENLTHVLFQKGTFSIIVTHFMRVNAGKAMLLAVKVSAEGKRLYEVAPAEEVLSSYADDVLKKYGLDSESLEKEEST